MRVSLRLAIALLSGASLCLAPSSARADKAPRLDPAVTQVADAFVAAVLKGDAEAVGRLYLEDGVEMPNCAPSAAGRVAVEEYYRHLFQGPGRITGFTLDHAETRIEGKVAYAAGASRQTIDRGPALPPLVNVGKYLVVLRKAGDTWKVAYLIYNGDQPTPGAP